MTATDKIKELISRCKAGVHIDFNEHLNYYESAETYLLELADRGTLTVSEVNADVLRHMIATNTVVNIHFYPRTPVGFYSVYHYDLDAALDEALACLNNPKEATV